MTRALSIFCALLLAWADARAQQSYAYEAGGGSEETLDADLDLGLGSVRLRAASGRFPVVAIEGTIADQELTPLFAYDANGAHAEVVFEVNPDDGISMGGLRGAERNRWGIAVSDRVLLDLDFALGVGEADLDLTGLRVERLELSSGMARTRVRFDAPNPVPMKLLSVEAGMAPVEMQGLGHARFERFEFEGGMGSFRLDFSGDALLAGARADVEVGMGKLYLILPDDGAIVLTAPDSWVSRIRIPDGYTKEADGVWHSPEVRDPSDALHIHVETGMGSVECVLASE